jgi:O-phosphoseryl-tRNA(Cys) synthetase
MEKKEFEKKAYEAKKILNDAGYATYIENFGETLPIYGTNQTLNYVKFGGKSWENPFTVNENEIDKYIAGIKKLGKH